MSLTTAAPQNSEMSGELAGVEALLPGEGCGLALPRVALGTPTLRAGRPGWGSKQCSTASLRVQLFCPKIHTGVVFTSYSL